MKYELVNTSLYPNGDKNANICLNGKINFVMHFMCI